MGAAVLKSAVKKSAIGLALLALLPASALADKTDNIVNNGVTRQKSGAASQKRIDDLSEKTERTIAQYHQQRKNVEEAQQVAMKKLERSIEDASLIERQIVPLMLSMIDGLEKFIDADIPFKLDERRGRVERIKGYLTNANISAAERFRQVLEAYSIESSYGQAIDVFVEELELANGPLTVNILQVGRVGLYYLTTDGEQAGYWDQDEKAWKELDSSHNAGIAHSIRMYEGKEDRNLMRLPIKAPEAI